MRAKAQQTKPDRMHTSWRVATFGLLHRLQSGEYITKLIDTLKTKHTEGLYGLSGGPPVTTPQGREPAARGRARSYRSSSGTTAGEAAAQRVAAAAERDGGATQQACTRAGGPGTRKCRKTIAAARCATSPWAPNHCSFHGPDSARRPRLFARGYKQKSDCTALHVARAAWRRINFYSLL